MPLYVAAPLNDETSTQIKLNGISIAVANPFEGSNIANDNPAALQGNNTLFPPFGELPVNLPRSLCDKRRSIYVPTSTSLPNCSAN